MSVAQPHDCADCRLLHRNHHHHHHQVTGRRKGAFCASLRRPPLSNREPPPSPTNSNRKKEAPRRRLPPKEYPPPNTVSCPSGFPSSPGEEEEVEIVDCGSSNQQPSNPRRADHPRYPRSSKPMPPRLFRCWRPGMETTHPRDDAVLLPFTNPLIHPSTLQPAAPPNHQAAPHHPGAARGEHRERGREGLRRDPGLEGKGRTRHRQTRDRALPIHSPA